MPREIRGWCTGRVLQGGWCMGANGTQSTDDAAGWMAHGCGWCMGIDGAPGVLLP